jgi:hypothetical protein
MLQGGQPGVARSTGEEHKRIRQLPNDGQIGERREDWSRVKACTRILLGVDQWWFLGRCTNSAKKQNRRY